MFKKICDALASCFNAHLSETDQEFQQAVIELRAAKAVFNSAVDKVNKYRSYGRVWIYINKGYGSTQLYLGEGFSITNIKGEITYKKTI
jgi:hypothetical protein